MPTPITGKDGQFSAEGEILCADSWSVDSNPTQIDTYNYCSNGWDEGTYGRKSFSATISAYWDRDKNPYGNPPNIIPGTIITNVRLSIDKNVPALDYIFPLFRVDNVNVTHEVDGLVRWEISGKSQGTVTLPGGIIPA